MATYYRGRGSFLDFMDMKLDYLNTLYKIAIDREKAERKRRDEEEKKRQAEEKKRQRLTDQMVRQGRFVRMPQQRRRNPYSMSRPEAEAFEDMMLEEGLI